MGKYTVTSTIYVSDIKKFHDGNNFKSYEMLGCRVLNYRGKDGAVFCVWAPNATKVGVVGDFNNWKGSSHLMLPVKNSGLWWLFIEGIKDGDLYKYEIHTRDGRIILKADPYAFYSEERPNTASIARKFPVYEWNDKEWLENRKNMNLFEKPINIYEIHFGSWRKKADGSFYSYREIADILCSYIKEMGYTHVEILPLMEHPLDRSWGYQPTGFYSVTSRYGTPEDFMYFVDKLHQNGIGVIMDWVPGHFCKDEHGLYHFDGTSLYEYDDPALKENSYWGTANFNVAKPEVQCFLISNALFWFNIYHIDGLRSDAITNMIYLNEREGDYESKGAKETIEFLKKLNKTVFENTDNPLMIAEESSAFPLVTYPTYDGGLGFNYKWDMGWMNDTLKYMQKYPTERKSFHNLITFSLMYTYSENFILPLSHDEVVHGKRSLIDKMPGEYEEKFANLRLLFGYMMCHPGKKLLFMGGEFAHFIEWNFAKELDWFLLDYPMHKKMRDYVKDLNHFYLQNKALWELDHDEKGFLWIDANNASQSIISFIRYSKTKEDFLVVICNFSNITYNEYKVGVPEADNYIEVLNSDMEKYGGNNIFNEGSIKVLDESLHGKPCCINIKLPALSALIFKPLKENDEVR
jgi:1,4-alpha-glucan branching enzyme